MGNKRGPKGPQKPIDWEMFEQLCSIHCSQQDICFALKVSESKLKRDVKKQYGMTFEQVYPSFMGKGRISLRRVMWSMALKGNVTLIRDLAANYLGHSEKHETVVSGDFAVENRPTTLKSLIGQDPVQAEMIRALTEHVLDKKDRKP